MPSYTSLVVLALVASNVSPALSAPVRRVREQSLSYRGLGPAVVGKAAAKTSGITAKKIAEEFAISTGATMAFAYLFEKMNGKTGASAEKSSAASASSTSSALSDSSNTANTATTANNQAYPSYSTSTDPSYSSSTYPSYSSSTYPSYSSSTYPTAQTQNGNQQRAVRDLPADIFEARSTSDNNNQKRQTPSLDLLGRTDLVEAIRLFSRMLDELD